MYSHTDYKLAHLLIVIEKMTRVSKLPRCGATLNTLQIVNDSLQVLQIMSYGFQNEHLWQNFEEKIAFMFFVNFFFHWHKNKALY